jgi:hypothetical protein
VPDKIFEVAKSGLADGELMIFLFSNPTRNSGKFQRVCFGSERNGWITRSVDSGTSKITNKKQITDWIDYGEESNLAKVRVRGERPSRRHESAYPKRCGCSMPQVQGQRVFLTAEDSCGGSSAIQVLRESRARRR